MSSKILNILFVIIILGLLILNIKSCKKHKAFTSSVENILNYKDTAKVYKSKLGKYVYYNEDLKVTLKELTVTKDSLINLLEDLKIKKPKNITKIITEVKYVDIPIIYKDTIPCDTFIEPFKYKDKWLTINGISSNNGFFFKNLNVTSGITLVKGEKKNGFLKQNEEVISVISDNPYLKVNNISSYTIKPKKIFYDKWWFKTILFGTGIIVGSNLQ